MTDHDRTWWRRFGRDSLQPARAAHPVAGESADFLRDVGLHRGDGVVVLGLDPHHARGFRCTKANRKHCSESDRHLAEDVSGTAFAHNALDPVDELDRVDPTLEDGEQRALAAFGDRILACY